MHEMSTGIKGIPFHVVLTKVSAMWGKPPDRGDTTPRHEPRTGREQSRNTPLGG